jgi:ribose transport system substrate-binding protein
MRYMRTTSRIGCACLLVGALALTACGSSDSGGGSSSDSGSGGGDGGKKPVKVAMVTAQKGLSFFVSMECGAKQAAQDLGGVDLSTQAPPDFDVASQQPMLQAAAQRKPDAMVFVPTDPKALVAFTQDLTAKNIPAVTLDGNLDQPVDTQNIRTDNKAAGQQSAQVMAEAIGDSGTVLMIGLTPGVPANQERIDSFKEEIEKNHPNIKLLETLYPGADQNKAATQASAAIRANPDLKGIYVSHLAAAQGAASAILGAEKRGEIKLIAYDADPEQVRDLKEGVYDALVVQKPYTEGYEATTLAVQVARGEVKADSVEDVRLIAPVIATRENIDSPEVSEFLYKTSC